MSKGYPAVGDFKRRPKPKNDGIKGKGLPCIVCHTNTLGQRFIEVSWMRGDDECVRVCSSCCKHTEKIIEAFLK